MSTELAVIKYTGKYGQDLQVVQFNGGRGIKYLQLTQGIGSKSDPGFIQLSREDAVQLVQEIDKWLRDTYYENQATK